MNQIQSTALEASHEGILITPEIEVQAPTMRRGSGFFRRFLHRTFSTHDHRQPPAPSNEYPGDQRFQNARDPEPLQRSQSFLEEDILTKTTVKLEAILLAVNLLRASLKVVEDDGGPRLDFRVESLTKFSAELWREEVKMASQLYEKGDGMECNLRLGDTPDTAFKYSLVLRSTEDIPTIISEGKMMAGVQVNIITFTGKPGEHPEARLESQRLLIDSYEVELLEIYGQPQMSHNKPVSSSTSHFTANSFDLCGLNKECVVCLSQRRDTLFLPCRHMCLCLQCAESLCLQSDKCPICRQEFRSLMNLRPL